MRRRLGTLLFLSVLGAALPGPAAAEEPPPDATVVLERPPEGPRRGLLAVPASAVYGVAAVALVTSFGYLVRRIGHRSP
jgi:hypothetical protein